MISWLTLTNEDAPIQVADATIRIDRSKTEPAVIVNGRVTVDSAPRLRSLLFGLIEKKSARVLVMDLSGVSHIDISGLATLLEVLICAYEHSMRLRLVGINGQPRKVAELAQMDQIFLTLKSEVEFS
jgi:anti-anti-sigma factor